MDFPYVLTVVGKATSTAICLEGMPL